MKENKEYKLASHNFNGLTNSQLQSGFYVEPTDSVGVQDNSVSFTCIVHGESEAAISWIKYVVFCSS